MRESSVVTQTVILAAGMGSRLANGSTGVPKPLVTVGGVPLIARALDHARASGCTEAVVVTGYEGERVRASAEALAGSLTIRFANCPDPSAPNGVSLLRNNFSGAGATVPSSNSVLVDNAGIP